MRDLKGCIRCGAMYAPYKVGDYDTEVLGFWCCVPMPRELRSGLCCFCNPKSRMCTLEGVYTPNVYQPSLLGTEQNSCHPQGAEVVN